MLGKNKSKSYICKLKGISNGSKRLHCRPEKPKLSGFGDNFGFPWAALIPVAGAAVGAVGAYFEKEAAEEEKEAAQAQIPVAQIQRQTAYEQSQAELLMQQQRQKAERNKMILYGVLGGLGILVLAKKM